jgi:hypothetical protein
LLALAAWAERKGEAFPDPCMIRSLPLCLLHHANAHAHQATRRREILFRAPLLASSLLVVRPTSIVMHGDLPMPMPVMITSTRTSQQEYHLNDSREYIDDRSQDRSSRQQLNRDLRRITCVMGQSPATPKRGAHGSSVSLFLVFSWTGLDSKIWSQTLHSRCRVTL